MGHWGIKVDKKMYLKYIVNYFYHVQYCRKHITNDKMMYCFLHFAPSLIMFCVSTLCWPLETTVYKVVSSNNVTACLRWYSNIWLQISPCNRRRCVLHWCCHIILTYSQFTDSNTVRCSVCMWLSFCMWRVLHQQKSITSWWRCMQHLANHWKSCACGTLLSAVAGQFLFYRHTW